jgi:hypothetical protein
MDAGKIKTGIGEGRLTGWVGASEGIVQDVKAFSAVEVFQDVAAQGAVPFRGRGLVHPALLGGLESTLEQPEFAGEQGPFQALSLLKGDGRGIRHRDIAAAVILGILIVRLAILKLEALKLMNCCGPEVRFKVLLTKSGLSVGQVWCLEITSLSGVRPEYILKKRFEAATRNGRRLVRTQSMTLRELTTLRL